MSGFPGLVATSANRCRVRTVNNDRRSGVPEYRGTRSALPGRSRSCVAGPSRPGFKRGRCRAGRIVAGLFGETVSSPVRSRPGRAAPDRRSAVPSGGAICRGPLCRPQGLRGMSSWGSRASLAIRACLDPVAGRPAARVPALGWDDHRGPREPGSLLELSIP